MSRREMDYGDFTHQHGKPVDKAGRLTTRLPSVLLLEDDATAPSKMALVKTMRWS